MTGTNHMQLQFLGCPENESFARVVIAAFAVQLSPTVSEIGDIKTAVSEAVTNAIVHGYEGSQGMVSLLASYTPDGVLMVEVSDNGKGIDDVAQAMAPFYTTRPHEERSGMGFAVMQTFMDDVEVTSSVGLGTVVRMRKTIAAGRSK